MPLIRAVPLPYPGPQFGPLIHKDFVSQPPTFYAYFFLRLKSFLPRKLAAVLIGKLRGATANRCSVRPPCFFLFPTLNAHDSLASSLFELSGRYESCILHYCILGIILGTLIHVSYPREFIPESI